MVSQYPLSKAQEEYLTSQNYTYTNPSHQRGLISKKIDTAFKLFDMTLSSQHLKQEFKDKWFDVSKVEKFLDQFIRYDKQNSASEEINKQAICKIMMTKGLQYFKDRYGEIELIKENIKQATRLIHALEALSNQEIYDSESMEMYRARKRTTRPQIPITSKHFWYVECKYCFNTTTPTVKTEKEAMKNLRHAKGCLYTKDIKKGDVEKDIAIKRYIVTYPPKDKMKKT